MRALALFLSLFTFFQVAVASDSLSFIIMGDSGTGTEKQYKAAAAMKDVCDKKGCDAVFGLGDNIYEFGPWSEQDKQFKDKFEAPFALINKPFFMALGNHDTSGLIPGDGAVNPRGTHEVNYTNHSDKWKMPNRYYTVNDAKSRSLFIVYDSTPPNAYVIPFWNPYWWPNGTYMKKQYAWITQELAKANNSAQPPKWKFALAHHPLMTNGHHHNDPLVQGKQPYKNFMTSLCGKVDFLFAGHEHALEILDSNPECKNTRMLVSGAAGKNNGKRSDKLNFPSIFESFEQKLGFFHAKVQGNNFTVTAYTVNDDGKYQQAFAKTFTK